MTTVSHTQHAHAGHAGHHHKTHRVPLWGLFLALTALTAAEVTLFEIWHRVEAVNAALPKFAMVLLILVFTLPKAAIVLIYFMHLKFERQLVVALAILPFAAAAVAVLPTLTDARTLKGQGRTLNADPTLAGWVLDHDGDGHGAEHGEHGHAPEGAAAGAAHGEEHGDASDGDHAEADEDDAEAPAADDPYSYE